jgi:hypothetical protein
MYGNPEGAAFGIYPKAGKRSEDKQDREAAKNFPVDLARGVVAGAVGMPGDIESLIRMLPGLNEKTVLPTSEDVLKRIPFGSDSPTGRFASGLGTLIGGSAPVGPAVQGVKAGARGALSAARAGERMAERVVPQIMERGGAGADILRDMAQGSRSQIFIGPKAKTFHQGRADMAVAMEEAGRTPQEIWLATGTFRGADGILRQEIDDRAARFLTDDQRKEIVEGLKGQVGELKEQVKPTKQKDLFPKALTEARKEVKGKISELKDEIQTRGKNPSTQGLEAKYIFEHPELYKAYPELADLNITTGGGDRTSGTLGSLSVIPKSGDSPGAMAMDIYRPGLSRDPTSISLHEMQHAVQTLEGMGPGGSPAMAFNDPIAQQILKRRLDEIRSPGTFEEFQRANRFPEDKAREAYEEYVRTYKPFINPKIEREVQKEAAMEYYKRLAGEAEARAVQDRQLMTPAQRRETPPPASYDVPQEDLIVKPPREYADGGPVHFSDNPDVMALELQAGGLVKGLKAAAKAAKEPAQAPMKASEALGRIEGRPLVITQTDRTKVGGGFLGGPGFSSLQLTEPEYRAAEAAWGVKTPGVAKMILGGGKKAGPDPVYTTFIGTPTQHQSNQMVFDKLYGDFKKAAKKGGLDPELKEKINYRLANAVDKDGRPIFPPDVDILDKNFRDLATTFDQRAVTSSLIGGLGVGGKKGQIIDYDKIIRNTTDPALLDVPTGALGNRLFTLSGGIIDRPDLHPAFPTILQGEDLGVSFEPVIRDLVMKDFIEKTMREKGRPPGYMDYTRGHPPSQLITEDILTEMQKLGKKKGGAVNKAEGGEITADDLILEERKL